MAKLGKSSLAILLIAIFVIILINVIIAFKIHDATKSNVREYLIKNTFHITNVTKKSTNISQTQTIISNVNKSTTKSQNLTIKLQKWNKSETILAFMHIGKAGGTSFDKTIKPPLKKYCGGLINLRINNFPQHKLINIESTKNKCYFLYNTKHFDFSPLQYLYPKISPISMIREPISWFFSMYYYTRTLAWTKELRIRKYDNIYNYFNDSLAMKETGIVWQDGNSAVNWFSGLNVHYGMSQLMKRNNLYSYINTDRKRLEIWNNRSKVLKMAIDNYHKFIAVGLLEDLDNTINLMKYSLGINLQFKHANKNKRKNNNIINDINLRKIVSQYFPMDIWFYNYVKNDFYKKIDAIKNGKDYIQRDIIKIPNDKELGGCQQIRVYYDDNSDKHYYQVICNGIVKWKCCFD